MKTSSMIGAGLFGLAISFANATAAVEAITPAPQTMKPLPAPEPLTPLIPFSCKVHSFYFEAPVLETENGVIKTTTILHSIGNASWGFCRELDI